MSATRAARGAGEFPITVRAVAIDLDGTMLDTVEDLAQSVNGMLQRLSLRGLSEAQIRTFVGKGLANLVERSLGASLGHAPAAELMERAMPVYAACYDEVNGRHTTMYPGCREGLDALKAAGFTLGCVTNKSARFTEPLLEFVGLRRYFSLVVSGDTLPRRKPDPLPLTHSAAHFGVAPGEMLMIGDSLNDAQAARAAGCPVFCVDYGYNEGQDVRSLDADAIVGSILDVLPLIRTP